MKTECESKTIASNKREREIKGAKCSFHLPIDRLPEEETMAALWPTALNANQSYPNYIIPFGSHCGFVNFFFGVKNGKSIKFKTIFRHLTWEQLKNWRKFHLQYVTHIDLSMFLCCKHGDWLFTFCLRCNICASSVCFHCLFVCSHLSLSSCVAASISISILLSGGTGRSSNGFDRSTRDAVAVGFICLWHCCIVDHRSYRLNLYNTLYRLLPFGLFLPSILRLKLMFRPLIPFIPSQFICFLSLYFCPTRNTFAFHFSRSGQKSWRARRVIISCNCFKHFVFCLVLWSYALSVW